MGLLMPVAGLIKVKLLIFTNTYAGNRREFYKLNK